jgi:2-oxoglutarate ferredoxin oxidoreductase subunit beta
MTDTFTPANPIWCAGCGHYGVQGAVVHALNALEIPADQTMVLAGIGCAGTLQNNVSCYGYHAMHGRVLPAAIGVALANPNLTVIAVGGDGDGYAIGAGHLVHSLQRNPNILYIVMNNAVYGLTKGQDSPTATGRRGAASEAHFDAIRLGLSISGTSFLARGFTRWGAQLNRLMAAALEHVRAGRGLAFLEVLSPCVTYNDTYTRWEALLHNVEEDPHYDPTDRVAAFALATRLGENGQMPAGQIYCGEKPASGAVATRQDQIAPAQLDCDPAHHRERHYEIMAGYAI